MTDRPIEAVDAAWQRWRDAVVAYHDEMRKYVPIESADEPYAPPHERFGPAAVERLDELYWEAEAAQAAFVRATSES